MTIRVLDVKFFDNEIGKTYVIKDNIRLIVSSLELKDGFTETVVFKDAGELFLVETLKVIQPADHEAGKKYAIKYLENV